MVVTNNKKVLETYPNQVQFIEGSILDVFLRCEQLLKEGYDLVTHPLSGNLQVSKTPFKSVVLERSNENVQPKSLELVRLCIEKVKEGQPISYPDAVLEDFAFMDLELIREPLEELL